MNLAIYKYQVARGVFPNQEFDKYEMRVEIIGETEKMYEVKYLDYHANGAPPGHKTRVKKKNVKRQNYPAPLPGRTLSNGIKYIPDLEDIRKPYKDD